MSLDLTRDQAGVRKKGAMVPALNAFGKGISAIAAIKGHLRALIWC
ncbi:hypothetical protein [Pseudomonas abietaniphila]|nr:hypothetical protein [Pseudomonas abietaniphila]